MAWVDANMLSGLTSRRLSYAGIIGNGRTCALIDSRGRIGWLCLPTFAQFPVFASLLDPVHGGRLEFGILTDNQIFWSSDYGDFAHRYLSGTNVLETIWTIADWRVTIRDMMAWGQNILVRDVSLQIPQESSTLLIRIRPTFSTLASTRFSINRNGISIEETRCPTRGSLTCDCENAESALVQVRENEMVYECKPRDNRLVFRLHYTDDSTKINTRLAHSTIADGEQSDHAWLSHAVQISLPDPKLSDAFVRSLLALRLLTYAPTGALIAAATASFPSKPGGQRNWDYRFCWVRDGCYAARAFDLAGCHREAENLYHFLLDRESSGQWRSPLWAIEPDFPTAEEQVGGLFGPAGETPIRIGNNAALQDQHDSPGNMIAGVYEHCILTGAMELANDYWQPITRAANWCCDHWAELEAGIWEKRDRNRAWVHGRAMCWVALRDAIRLAELLNKPASSHWTRAKAAIAQDLAETGWSEDKGVFLRACGEPSIYDISVLSLLLENLIPADELRIRRTVATLAKHLAYGAAFRRDEQDTRDPFYLGTFWMIRALQRIGEYDRAYDHLRVVIASTTNLGLMAEYFDPATSRQYGNFPQAFSHEELVRTVSEMLWRLEDNHLFIFPAIPAQWLMPGTTLTVSNIPFSGKRGTITLTIHSDALDFVTSETGPFDIVIPSRFLTMGKRVTLNCILQT